MRAIVCAASIALLVLIAVIEPLQRRYPDFGTLRPGHGVTVSIGFDRVYFSRFLSEPQIQGPRAIEGATADAELDNAYQPDGSNPVAAKRLVAINEWSGKLPQSHWRCLGLSASSFPNLRLVDGHYLADGTWREATIENSLLSLLVGVLPVCLLAGAARRCMQRRSREQAAAYFAK